MRIAVLGGLRVALEEPEKDRQERPRLSPVPGQTSLRVNSARVMVNRD